MCSTLRIFALLLLVGCALSQVYNEGLTANCKEPAGVPDAFQNGMCNCYSGYAPSSAEGTDCNTHPRCAGLSTDASDVLGGNQPSRPTAVFANDHLIITQKAPIVSNRKGSKIAFLEPLLRGMPGNQAGRRGSDTCFYPGLLWKKEVDALDCQDVFTASLPWSQSEFCGFVKDTNVSTSERIWLKTTLVHSYTETHHLNNRAYDRELSSSYLITVSFLARKTIDNEMLSVEIPDSTQDGFVRVAVVGNSVYDVASGTTIVDFRTTVAWPYQLDPEAQDFKNVVPDVAGLGDVTITYDDDFTAECTTAQDTECTQRWRVVIPAESTTCDIQGKYTFEGSLMCRDVATDDDASQCPTVPPPVEFSINIKKTELCAPEALDTTAENTYVLTPYYAEEDTTPTFTFQTGDVVFWDLTITDPLASIDTITIKDVELSLEGAGGVVAKDHLYADHSNTAQGNLVSFEINQQVAETIAPGHPGVLKFQLQLLRSALLNTVAALSNAGVTAVQVKTTVTVDILYHGNQARDVEETDEIAAAKARSTIAQSRTIQLLISPESDQSATAHKETPSKSNEVLEELDNSAASTITPLFGLFVALFVAFALKF